MTSPASRIFVSIDTPEIDAARDLAERLTGHGAQAVAFGTEAPYLQRLGCDTLVLGPGDIDCAHQPGEHLELARIEPTVALMRQLIQHYCLTRSEDVQRR